MNGSDVGQSKIVTTTVVVALLLSEVDYSSERVIIFRAHPW